MPIATGSASSEITGERWDAVIIGTGIGGATLGYALAQAGWRVLFCEKGRSNLQSGSALRGDYPESGFPRAGMPRLRQRELLRQAGRWCDEIADLSEARPRRFTPLIGCGTGGSSALYGMALERFFPADFTPRKYHPRASDSSLPERWPISYHDLAPHYAAAEELFGVRGTRDPLRAQAVGSDLEPPPALSLAAQELADFFVRQGLHPYRLPLACRFVPGCRGCQGYLCASQCKNDSAQACLWPAIEKHGARLLDECEILRLEARGDRVSGVVCRREGQELRLEARIIVLAAGALASPALLLRSASPEWPTGLANDSGGVGKNLMRHCVDLYAVFPQRRYAIGGNAKELAWSDYYLTEDAKLGSFQSFGAMPPAPMLVESMQQEIRDKLGGWAGVAIAPAKPLLRPLLERVFSRALVFAAIMEDLPYADNQVLCNGEAGDAARIAIRYRLREADAKRLAKFRDRVAGVLKPYRFLLFKQAYNNRRLAHVCGTCRFGTDPRESVLDVNNKAHGLANLYVVDASFFPSSGGTNPALTIAANALRVAAHLVGRPLRVVSRADDESPRAPSLQPRAWEG